MRARMQTHEIELQRIARAIARTPSHVSRLFSDDPKQRRGTTLEVWKRIAECIGVTLDELAEMRAFIPRRG